ncbi:MAG: universal stress protein [Chitinophagaceae bacterium]
MRKILLAFDGKNFSEEALRFVAKLNDKDKILLTGAFLPQTDYASLWSYSGGGTSGKTFLPLQEDEDAKEIENNIKRFVTFCHTNDIKHTVHKDYYDFAIPELEKESRYADLLILSSEHFYEQAGITEMNEYLKEAIHKIECPVIVIPEKTMFPDCNILCYDGTRSSVYAIRQFAYLFPELTDNPTVIFYAKEEAGKEMPEEQKIRELVDRHFTKVEWWWLQTNPKKNIIDWLKEKQAAIVVSGAFGRSDVSMLFHKSFVAQIISAHFVPVFIAHK